MPDSPASELLRKLDEQTPHAPTHWQMWEIRKALPALIAVVEAAELIAAPVGWSVGLKQMPAVLADLRRELGGGA